MPTLRQYRRTLGYGLGWYVVSANTTTGSTAGNTIVIPDFADVELESRFAAEVWGFIASSGLAVSDQQRRVRKEGIAPATGLVTFARAFSAEVSTGTTVEFSGVLPVKDALGRTGLHTCINDALRECWFVDRVSVPHASTAYQIDLSSAVGSWLDDERRIIDVYTRSAGSNRDCLLSEWTFLHDGEGPTLELRSPLSSADELKVAAFRPMHTWTRQGGTWANSTIGLSTETDEALLPLDGMRTVGLAHAYEAAASFDPDKWEKKAARQRIAANAWKTWSLPRETGREVHWQSRAFTTVGWPGTLSSA